MRHLPLTTLLLVLLPVVSFGAPRDGAGARAIIDKAIQAHGGAAQVARLRTMHLKAEGTTSLVPGHPHAPFTVEDTWQMPDRYKTSITFTLQGKQFTQTQAIDGNQGWIQNDDQVQPLTKAAVAEMKEQKYAEDLGRLGFLGDKSISLSVLADTKVQGKPAVGVLVKSKGHRDVKLYFDRVSSLLVKREQMLQEEPKSKPVRQEIIFSDYQVTDGLKHYRKMIGLRDGRQVIQARITQVEYLEKLDPKVFAKP